MVLSREYWIEKATVTVCKTYNFGAVQYIEYIRSQEKVDSGVWYWFHEPQLLFLPDLQFALCIQPRCGCATIWIRSAFAMTSIVAVKFCPAILIPMA